VGARIELTGIRAMEGGLETLHGVDVVLPAGTLTALLGSNDSGTSTLLRVVAGLVTPVEGTVLWNGEEATRLAPLARVRRGMIYLPNVGGVFEALTVSENLALFARGRPVEEAFEAFPELTRLLARNAGTLSGGERQMLTLSRAFVRPAEIVLADEVSAGLAAAVTTRVYDAFARLTAAGTTVVALDQFADDALRHAGLAYAMRRGAIAFAGEPAELTAQVRRSVLR
jgi:branched-chain amino acid transport system ATP-binding protein